MIDDLSRHAVPLRSHEGSAVKVLIAQRPIICDSSWYDTPESRPDRTMISAMDEACPVRAGGHADGSVPIRGFAAGAELIRSARPLERREVLLSTAVLPDVIATRPNDVPAADIRPAGTCAWLRRAGLGARVLNSRRSVDILSARPWRAVAAAR